MNSRKSAETMNSSSWFTNLAYAFRFPVIRRPTIAYWMGAILFSGLIMLIAVWGEDSLTHVFKKPSDVVSFAVVTIAVGYLGAIAFGIVAFLSNPQKYRNFWRDQVPVALMHWAGGIACCGLMLFAGLAIAKMAEAPNIVARIKLEADSGRLAFVIAMLLFSLRASWYCLIFSFPRLSPCQYAIFFVGFATLFAHFGFDPNGVAKPPTQLISMLSWCLLCMDRIWKRIESQAQCEMVSIATWPVLFMAFSNIATVGVMVSLLWAAPSNPTAATVWTGLLTVVLSGALVGLANLRWASHR